MATNPNINAYEAGRKSVGVAYLLWIVPFLGPFGAHRFYTRAGKTGWWMLTLHLGGWALSAIALFALSTSTTETYESAFGISSMTSYNMSTTGGIVASLGKLMRGIAWIWWVVDLFLVPGLVRRFNSRLAASLGLGPLA